MRRTVVLALVAILPLAACALSSMTPPVVSTLPTPDAYGVIQCMENTACFWHAYRGCGAGTVARVNTLFARSADGNGNVASRWRTLSSGTPGAPCAINVFEQVTIAQPNGHGGGAPGADYQCAQVTRDPTGALHLASCQQGGSAYPDVDVAAHG